MTRVLTYNTNQIGGNVVVIEDEKTKIVIDFGENLEGSDSENVNLPGLTYGEKEYDAVFFTHYHGDHIGRIGEILPDIPLYMGVGARKIMTTIARAVKDTMMVELLSNEERITLLKQNESVTVGDMRITPYMVDHSAYESFMFLIETKDKTILHTGDYRAHGYRGKKGLLPTIEHYIRQDGKRDIDILITEGTMLSRQEEKLYTEMDLQKDAAAFFQKNKYIFLICSSTNADSLASFYQAGMKYGMHMYGNWYVKEQLQNFRELAAAKSSLYDFKYVHQWKPYGKGKNGQTNLEILEKYGFVTIIKGDKGYEKWIDEFERRTGKKARVIYSMWSGYIKPGKCYNEELAHFCEKYQAVFMHTSGHASKEVIQQVIKAVDPKEKIYLIHTEKPELLDELQKTIY